MERKPFNKELFENNDKTAREITKSFYKDRYGFSINDNPNIYGADLMWENHLIECEIKNVWKDDIFPYSNVQIPERKSKIFLHRDFWEFIMINNNLTVLLSLDKEQILSSPIVEVNNKYISKGEYFYQVPIEFAKFYHI